MPGAEAFGLEASGAAASTAVTPATLRFYDRRARELRAAAQAAVLRRLARAPRRGVAALIGALAPSSSLLPR